MLTILHSLFFILFVLALVGCSQTKLAMTGNYVQPKLIQVIEDGIDGANGLDNARDAVITHDNMQILVVSADDNAFTHYDVGNNFTLKLKETFTNNNQIDSLTGANALVLSPDNQFAYVVSFYDSALSVFKKGNKGRFHFIQAVRDGLSYQRIFKDERPIGSQDKHGLLGAYDIAISHDGKQLYIASFVSNALAVFDIQTDGRVIFNQAIKNVDNNGSILNAPAQVAISANDSQLAVASYQGNAVHLFSRSQDGKLNWRQTLSTRTNNEAESNGPLGLAFSPDGKNLYVGLHANNGLLVFSKDDQALYSLSQSLKNAPSGQYDLSGISSIAITPEGSQLFAAAEKAHGINVFSREENGHLQFHSMIKNSELGASALKGVSSVNIGTDGKYLLATGGEGDSLLIFAIKDK